MLLYTKHWNGNIDRNTPDKYFFLKAIKENLPRFEATKIPILMQHPYPRDPQLLDIAQFLNQHLGTNYSIEEIAKKFGLSTRTLSRKFKEDLGMSYVRFLRSLRITKAFELIASKKHNMYEIAMMIGYGSLTTFSNIFYKIAGLRPTDYAKSLN
jgi:transcriptional regulator GlxA family with amidase domain